MASFEELADRLTKAQDPKDRLAAAEALAALDDHRVAPTLARALADHDPTVRARAEALLGQFSRRDGPEHLEALLAAAERVAEALTAEVQRLRGGGRTEPEPAPVEPMPPPAGFEGACTLIRLTSQPMNIKAVSRILADALATPALEVSRTIAATKGFLARAVPAPLAARLVEDLARARVVAAAAPLDWLPPPAELLRLRDPVFSAAALAGRVGPSDTTTTPWEAVELALAARLPSEVEQGTLEEGWSPFRRPPSRRAEATPPHEPAYEFVVEVVAGSPARRLRLVTHDLDFKTMHRRISSFGKVASLAQELARHVAPHRLAAGLRRLADRDQENWEDLTFLSPRGLEDYVTWQRLLLKLGVPLPR